MNAFEIKIPPDRLKVLQIVGAALPIGALLFLVIVAVIKSFPNLPLNFDVDLYVIIFLAQAAMLTPAAFILPQNVFKSTASNAFAGIDLQTEIEKESLSDAEPKQINKFMEIYQVRLIIGSALLEGIAIFGIVVHLLNLSMISLIGSFVLILLMFANIPTTSRLQNCLANLATELAVANKTKT